jgi:hypothetical protein
MQRYLYLALALGPYSAVVPGVCTCGPAALAEAVGDVPDFSTHLAAMRTAGVVHHEGRMFVLPDVVADAQPENPNQVKAWRKGFNELPAGPLRDEVDALMRHLLIRHGNGHPVTLKDGRSDPCAYIQAWDPTFVKPSADVPRTSAERSVDITRTFTEGAAHVPATLAEPEEGEEGGAEARTGMEPETETRHRRKRGGEGGEKPASSSLTMTDSDICEDDLQF